MFIFMLMLKCLQHFDLIFIIKMLGNVLLSIAAFCVAKIYIYLTEPKK